MGAHRSVAGLCVLLAAAVALAGCSHAGLVGQVENQRTGPGDAAKDLVSSQKYRKLHVEIHAVPGFEPHSDAIDLLKKTVAEVTAKGTPAVTIHKDLVGRGEGHKYTWKEISDLEKGARQNYVNADTITLSILYLDGGSQDDAGDAAVLGAAYHATSLVMFKGNIKAHTVPDGTLLATKPEIRFVERAVLVHELGHAFGLVNNGAPMVKDHEDPDHRGHSKSRNSVMYYAVESSALFSIFTRGSDIPYTFDADDKADLAALRGD